MLSTLDILVYQAIELLFWPIVLLVFCYQLRDVPKRLRGIVLTWHTDFAWRGSSLWRLSLALSSGAAWLWLIRDTRDFGLSLVCSIIAIVSFSTTLSFFRSRPPLSTPLNSETLETFIVREAQRSGGEITKAELLSCCSPFELAPLPRISRALQALERSGVAVRDIDIEANVEYWHFPGLHRNGSRSVRNADVTGR
jgi:hypothetical protein